MRGFHLFQIIVEPTAQLQAYIGWDPPSRLNFAAFRGRCTSFLRSWIVDLEALPRSLSVTPGTCTSSLRNWIADLEALPRSLSYPNLWHARVHRGFYSAPQTTDTLLSLSFLFCTLVPFSPVLPFQAYVGWDPPSRLIIVAFRGTCTSSLRNWIADLEALPRSLSYPGLWHARVHRGFYSAPQTTDTLLSLSFLFCTLVPFSPVLPFQAYVGWDPPSRLIIVAFRGTCTSSLRNWIADLEALPRSLSYPGLRHARVHRGFYSAYHFTRLRPAVVHAVLFLMTILPGSFRVAFTGHSLGGALATLSALDLQVSYDLPSPSIRVVTFGSPRVGNAAFAAYFRQKVPGSTRVTNWKDLVPHLPPATIGYHHVATEAWIIPDSVHNVSFSLSSSTSQSEQERSGLTLSLPRRSLQRRSLQRRVFQHQFLRHGTSQRQLLQEQTLLLDERGSQARHEGDMTWHVHQCDETGEDPCCS
ncbi:unnamed protein product, partial [Closterium sp. NIES-54]